MINWIEQGRTYLFETLLYESIESNGVLSIEGAKLSNYEEPFGKILRRVVREKYWRPKDRRIN